RWIYDKRVTDINSMTDLSKTGRERLASQYCIGSSEPKLCSRSTDGTAKYLFDGRGGRDIEAVMIPDNDRATICVSSQAGCKMNCSFCMTGRQGFHGNLDTADIINQILSIDESESLTNIVFMGMGEPLDNIDAVLAAIDIITAPWGLAWSPKRITVSSVGLPRNMRRLLEETKVHIAISVHSPYPAERASIMPVEKAWSITKVMDMLRDYDFAHQRRLSVEYIMFRGLNDDVRHADALARLVKGTSARVNLIRYHAIDADDKRQPATQADMEAFRDRLNEKGITATIRASRGQDIDAACGMLAGKQNEQTKHL
ncbi:MAG: 23S rRNA (adenine(2503)-C(2))-methyltransferase RlmN, partial [Muribaculaceae bacterium]|nr:23S rRNA (adenine(2503)-C(2))-methyltransferase RlmN [Muribaculaceae bacterium]